MMMMMMMIIILSSDDDHLVIINCKQKQKQMVPAVGQLCDCMYHFVSFCIIVSLYHHNLAQTLYHPLLSLAEGQFSDIKATTANELAMSK